MVYQHVWSGARSPDGEVSVPAPLELILATAYEKFGWTPDEVRKMGPGPVLRALQVLGIRDKAQRDASKK